MRGGCSLNVVRSTPQDLSTHTHPPRRSFHHTHLCRSRTTSASPAAAASQTMRHMDPTMAAVAELSAPPDSGSMNPVAPDLFDENEVVIMCVGGEDRGPRATGWGRGMLLGAVTQPSHGGCESALMRWSQPGRVSAGPILFMTTLAGAMTTTHSPPSPFPRVRRPPAPPTTHTHLRR